MSGFSDLLNEIQNNSGSITLEFGPGEEKKYKYSIGIDIVKKPTVDYVADLSKGLGFIETARVDLIYSSHFLEHIDDLEFFLAEVERVLKPGGVMIGVVPHFSNPYYYSDYTHKNFWGLYTLLYFSRDSYFKRSVPRYYNNIDFKIREINLIFTSPFLFRNLFKKFFTRFVNFSNYIKEFHEENLCGIFPCYEIYFEIEKK